MAPFLRLFNLEKYQTSIRSEIMGAGSSSATTYIESASGVSESDWTGLTVVVTGLLFFVVLFFAPSSR